MRGPRPRKLALVWARNRGRSGHAFPEGPELGAGLGLGAGAGACSVSSKVKVQGVVPLPPEAPGATGGPTRVSLPQGLKHDLCTLRSPPGQGQVTK